MAVVTSGLALLCLHVPAWLLGLDHVLDNSNKDVGYFVKYNWSLVCPLLAPVLLSLAVFAFRRMRDSVYQLIEKSELRIPVIEDEKGGVAEDYPLYLSKELAARAGWIEVLAGVAAFVITAVDTADLWQGFVNGGNFPKSRVPEWDTAFRVPGAHMYGHVGANLAFDVVAYAFQTTLIFFGLFFLIKYWSFLRIMVQIIDRNRPPYRFVPWVSDLHRRLGLKPLGWVFNLFLAVVVLYQAFSFYHRIELIDVYQHDPPGTYFKAVWAHAQPPKDAAGLLRQGLALLKLPVSDYAWVHLGNPSSWLPLFFSLPPILIVCLLPLGRLFWYLRQEVRSLTDLTSVALTQAKSDQDKKRADEMEKRLKCLQETTMWPNGSLAGSMYLILMIALLIGTACPPLLLWGLTSGIIVKLIWSVLGKSSRT